MINSDKRNSKIMLRFTVPEIMAINSVMEKEGNTIPISVYLRAMVLKIINSRLAKQKEQESVYMPV